MVDTFIELLVSGYGQFYLIGDSVFGGEYQDLKARVLFEEITS